MLNLKISDNLGIELPVASDTAEEIGKAIRIGVGDKSGRPVFSPLDYAIYADGDDIVLNASETALSQTDAIEKFIELFDGEAENGRLSIEISEDFKIVEGKKYSMEFVSAKRTAVLRNGVNQYEFHYKNLNGQSCDRLCHGSESRFRMPRGGRYALRRRRSWQRQESDRA